MKKSDALEQINVVENVEGENLKSKKAKIAVVAFVTIIVLTLFAYALGGDRDAYYSMNGDAKNVINVGHNDGTTRGFIFFDPGYEDRAAVLSGTDDFIEVTDSTGLDYTGDFTVEAAVYVSTFPAASESVRIVGKGSGYSEYSLDYTGVGSGVFRVAGQSVTSSPGAIRPMQWHKLIGTKQGNKITLYIDTNKIAETTSGAIVSDSSPVTMGYASGGVYHKGMIDEVRLRNEVPTDLFPRVTGITVMSTQNNNWINTGRSLKLIATVSPADAYDKSVTWSSDNTSVATVDSVGLVRAGNTSGTAEITVTTNDGGFRATHTVNVNNVALWYPMMQFVPANEIRPSPAAEFIPPYDEYSTTASQIKQPDYLPKQFRTSGSTVTISDVPESSRGPAEVMKVKPAGLITARISGTKLTEMKYQFIKVDDYNRLPYLPTATDVNWQVMANATGAAIGVVDEWGILYPDLIRHKRGYITVQHYKYIGNYGTGGTSRGLSFGTPINAIPYYKTAKVARNGVETYDHNGNRLVNSDPWGMSTSSRYNIDPYKIASYNEQDGNTAFFDPGYVGLNDAKRSLAAKKAIKAWGYLCPEDLESSEDTQVPAAVTGGAVTLSDSTDFEFSFYSDDGAYGYITINGEQKELCNDWRVAPPETRRRDVYVTLRKGTPYPIYMEWFEGCYTEGGFKMQYRKRGENLWKDVPSMWFYPSGDNTVGQEESYFEPTKELRFPTEKGYYYLAATATNQRGKATIIGVTGSGIATRQAIYGPFEVVENKMEVNFVDPVRPTVASEKPKFNTYMNGAVRKVRLDIEAKADYARMSTATIYVVKSGVAVTSMGALVKKIDYNFLNTHALNTWLDIGEDIPYSDFSGKGRIFDIKISISDTWGRTKEFELNEIELSISPAKLIDISVENKTTADLWRNAKDRINTSLYSGVDSNNIPLWKKYSELHYSQANLEALLGTGIDYPDGTVAGIPLVSKDLKYDGEYTKNNDNLKIAAKFISANIDIAACRTNGADMAQAYNVVAAKFVEINGNSNYIAPTSLTYTNETIDSRSVKVVTAVWDNIVVNNQGNSTPYSISLEVKDADGYRFTDKIINGRIEITKTNNVKPDITKNVSILFNGAPSFVSKENYYTNQNMDIPLNIANANMDMGINNAMRLIKVSYDYDYTKSDRAIASTTGYTAGNSSDAKKYFYITPEGRVVRGVTYTSPIIPFAFNGNEDDGNYKLYFQVVDKYGNMTDNSDYSRLSVKNSANELINIYADHIVPDIINTKKLKDSFTGNQPIRDYNNFKNGDKVRVEYTVKEANIPVNPGISVSAGAVIYFSQDNAGNENYADFSQIASSSNKGAQITAVTAIGERKTFTVLGGYKTTLNVVTSVAINVSSDGDKMVTLSARDMAGNITTTQVAFNVDNTAPTLSGNAYFLPVERLGYNGGNSVSTSITYAGISGVITTTQSIRASRIMSNVTEYGNWSEELRNLGGYTTGKTAYTKYEDGFIGLTNTATSGADYYEVKYVNKSGTPSSILISERDFKDNGLGLGLSSNPGVFIPLDILRTGAGGDAAGSKYIGASAGLRVIAWDFAGNSSEIDQINALMQDSAINMISPSDLYVQTGGVTLVPSNNVIKLVLNLGNIRDNVGIYGYRVRSFKDERGNVVSAGFKTSDTSPTYSLGTLVTSSAFLINAQDLLGEAQREMLQGDGIVTMSFVIAENAPFIGGKVTIDVDVVDHLNNTYTITRSFLVQRNMNIRSQDKNTHRETTIQINQGQQGNIINRQEGGR